MDFRENVKNNYRPTIRNFDFISFFLFTEETIATFAASGNISFIRLLLIACDSGTERISEAVFTSFGGILSIQEDFLL